MFMHLKTNSIVLICFIFFSRLLCVNNNLQLSSNTNTLTKHFAAIKERRHNVEANISPSVIMDYTEVEVCEEGPDNEENLVKDSSPVFLSTLFSALKYLAIADKSNSLSDLIKCDLDSKKYLTLSILRI